jgi:hypothetical protein
MGAAKKKANDATGGTVKKTSKKILRHDPAAGKGNKTHDKRMEILRRNVIDGDSKGWEDYSQMHGLDIEASRNKKRDAKRRQLDKEYGKGGGGLPGIIGPNGVAAGGVLGGPKFQSMVHTAPSGRKRLRDEFKMDDSGAWLKMQQQQQKLLTQDQLSNANQASLGQAAGAETALAARGGMDSGARERLMSDRMRNVNLQQQGVRNSSEINRLGLESDAYDKNQVAQQANIGMLAQNNRDENLHESNKYNEQMRAWAANKQSKATANSGDSGNSVLCSLLHEKGMLPYEVWTADGKYGREVIGLKQMRYYRSWAVPFAAFTRKHPLLLKLIAPIIKGWAYEMAYRMGAHTESNWIGRCLLKYALPVSNQIGKALTFTLVECRGPEALPAKWGK